jgi:diaminohydroxyphosphoribosylaminopyrimidine deaminase/5-amino-6-(5-phosphoribosylamino)uracil reductase
VDNPRLDVRLAYGPWVRQPLRVVLDSESGCPPDAAVFAGGNAVVFAATDAADRHGTALTTLRVPRSPRGLNLDAVLAQLAGLEMNEVLVECGARLAAGFIEAELVDEFVVYVAPRLLGADAAPLAALDGADAQRLPPFVFLDQRMIENDIRWVLAPRRA